MLHERSLWPSSVPDTFCVSSTPNPELCTLCAVSPTDMYIYVACSRPTRQHEPCQYMLHVSDRTVDLLEVGTNLCTSLYSGQRFSMSPATGYTNYLNSTLYNSVAWWLPTRTHAVLSNRFVESRTVAPLEVKTNLPTKVYTVANLSPATGYTNYVLERYFIHISRLVTSNK